MLSNKQTSYTPGLGRSGDSQLAEFFNFNSKDNSPSISPSPSVPQTIKSPFLRESISQSSSNYDNQATMKMQEDGTFKYEIGVLTDKHTGKTKTPKNITPNVDIDCDVDLLEPTIITQHAYDLQIEENFQNSGKTHIHMWCLDKQSNPVLIRITDFPVFTPVQLPVFVDGQPVVWNESTVIPILKYLKFVLKEDAPTEYKFVEKTLLHHYQADTKTPFLLLTFPNAEAQRHCKNLLNKPRSIRGVGNIKMQIHEDYISVIRKMLSLKNCRFAQWFLIIGREVPFNHELRASTRGTDDKPIKEYIAGYKSLTPISPEKSKGWMTTPRILSIDGEMYSSNHNAFPNKYDPNHPCYMLSCVYQVISKPETRKKILINIGGCDEIPGAEVRHAKDEYDLVKIFADIVREYDPEIITGYNIFSYDYPYLDARIKCQMLDWPHMGRLLDRNATMTTKTWKSGAYGHNSINNLVMEGRINIDMLPIIRRDYKLDKYTLDFVSHHFIRKGKHDVKAKDMFMIYELVKAAEDNLRRGKGNESELKHAYSEMARVGAYCLEDSALAIDLFDKLNVWIALVEMSSIVGVTILELFTRGQQIRCLSQLYDLSSKLGYVIDKRIASKLFYSGGHVGDPIVGLHDNVLCLDFTSLYPSIMQAYNICYTTLVSKEMEEHVPDEMCNINEFSQEEPLDGLPTSRGYDEQLEAVEGITDGERDEDEDEDKKTVTRHYRFKFVKKEVKHGILPQLVGKLMDERNSVKKQMGELKGEKKELIEISKLLNFSSIDDVIATLKSKKSKDVIETSITFFETCPKDESGIEIASDYINKLLSDIELTNIILDKRQLALKVSANSMYGFLGAQNGGMLPLIEAAMSITAWGRKLIKQVDAYIIDKYNGTIVYGDTDSSMFDIGIKDSSTCNSLGRRIAVEISGTPEKILPDGTIVPAIKGIFPPPLKVEFEKGMKILCLKKKKYAALLYNDDGSFKKDFQTGSLEILKRGIMIARRDNAPYSREAYIKLLTNVLTNVPVERSFEDIVNICCDVLEYKVPAKGNLTIIRGLGSDYKQAGYFMKVFADELKRIGKPANSGDRLEYVVVKTKDEIAGLDVPLGRKMRSIETYDECHELQRAKLANPNGVFEELSYDAEDIDAMYYIEHAFMNPLDQLFSIGYSKEIAGLENVGYTPSFSRCRFASVKTPIKMIAKMINDLLKAYIEYTASEKEKLIYISKDVRSLVGWFKGEMEKIKPIT